MLTEKNFEMFVMANGLCFGLCVAKLALLLLKHLRLYSSIIYDFIFVFIIFVVYLKFDNYPRTELYSRRRLCDNCISPVEPNYVAFKVSLVFFFHRLIQEFLGDALCFRGNYWSAMGIFEGVIEAAARDGQFADYSWSRRAFIKQLLKLDDEAEKEFEELHRRAAWHRQTCLQSLAQLQIKKAKAAFAAYFPICGIQCCQKAIDLLTE